MCSESTSSLGQEKLARLLRIGSKEDHAPGENDGGVCDQDKADLMQETVRTALLDDEPSSQSVPDIIRRACLKPPEPAREQVAFVLADAEIGLTTIQQIKNHAKALAKNAPSDLQREVATVVYFAAIASAVVHHDTVITKIALDKLCRSLEEVGSKTWLPGDVAAVIDRALQACKTRAGTS